MHGSHSNEDIKRMEAYAKFLDNNMARVAKEAQDIFHKLITPKVQARQARNAQVIEKQRQQALAFDKAVDVGGGKLQAKLGEPRPA